MKIQIDDEAVVILDPTLKKGKEAPAAQILLSDGNIDVVGSLQEQTQLIVGVPTLEIEPFPPFLETLDEMVTDMDRTRATVISGDPVDYLASLAAGQCFDHFRLAHDRNGMFATRFQLKIPEGRFKGKPAPSIVVVDVEGNLALFELLPVLDRIPDPDSLLETLNLCRSMKVREHSHNW